MDILDEVCVELKRANSIHPATFKYLQGRRCGRISGKAPKFFFGSSTT